LYPLSSILLLPTAADCRLPSAMPPPTIIVVHPRERRSKCSVEPLRERGGFVFWTYPERGPEPLDDYVRLGIGGPLLGPDDADRGLLILDGTWRRAAVMERDYADVPVRSLSAWRTAYPRVSKTFEDPAEGLATIEALFAAYTALGRDTRGLLDDYRWAERFLELNVDHLA
ncbi:MAG: hypothetical protein WD066_01885, partial [Planctomycetaceae bacterium]